MQESSMKMAKYFGAILDNRDYITKQHATRVSKFTRIIAICVAKFFPQYGLNEDDAEMIASAAMLHDIGKLSMTDSIIHKPVRMADDEYEILKSHTSKGRKMFEDVLNSMSEEDESDRRFFEFCADISMYHHERYDGGGYPEHKKRDEIPIAAQIVGLADAYDDLLSDRISKAACSKEEAYERIINGENGVFAPQLIRVFEMVRPMLEEIA